MLPDGSSNKMFFNENSFSQDAVQPILFTTVEHSMAFLNSHNFHFRNVTTNNGVATCYGYYPPMELQVSQHKLWKAQGRETVERESVWVGRGRAGAGTGREGVEPGSIYLFLDPIAINTSLHIASGFTSQK